MSFTIHRNLCLVPREWLGFNLDNLEVLVCKVIIEDLRHNKESTNCSVRIEKVSARLSYHNGHPWMQRVDDESGEPELTEYYGLFIPCAHCTEFM